MDFPGQQWLSISFFSILYYAFTKVTVVLLLWSDWFSIKISIRKEYAKFCTIFLTKNPEIYLEISITPSWWALFSWRKESWILFSSSSHASFCTIFMFIFSNEILLSYHQIHQNHNNYYFVQLYFSWTIAFLKYLWTDYN